MNYNIKINEHSVSDFLKDSKVIFNTIFNERYNNKKFKVVDCIGLLRFTFDYMYESYIVASYNYNSDDYHFNIKDNNYSVSVYEFRVYDKFLFSVISISDGVCAPINYRISDEKQMCKLRLSISRDDLPSFIDDVYIAFNN